MDDETDPAVDPKAVSTRPTLSQYDLEDHRCTIYIGYHVPTHRHRSHHKHHRHHHHKSPKNEADCDKKICEPESINKVPVTITDVVMIMGESKTQDENNIRKNTPPSERVQFILGDDVDGSHEPHPLFSEMEELFYDGSEPEWRETARWIKFEEDVEEGGNRWSKPHVATVSLHSLFELRSCMLNGSIILDMESQSLEEVVDFILDDMETHQVVTLDSREKIKQLLLCPHRHQHELNHEWSEKGSRIPLIRSFTEVGRSSSKMCGHHVLSFRSSFTPHMPSVVEENTDSSDGNSASAGTLSDNINHNVSSRYVRRMSSGKVGSSIEESSDTGLHRNQSFMRKIPPKAEASNILVGEIECLDKVVSCFIRLNESCNLGDLTEVPVPTRFLFVLLGPTGFNLKYHEIGRAMATLMTDEVFHGVAYKARTRSDLLAGVDEFLDATTVLPPGVWDPATRIEPPAPTSFKEFRKNTDPFRTEKIDLFAYEEESIESFDMTGKGRFFGGLINDFQQKAHWYISDFKDVFSLQCISSVVFLYFACIAQIILFGGLLAHATENQIAASECLLSALICGIVYSLFSGQPLTLLGSTGPILVYESILFDVCKKLSYDYLNIRLWIGLCTSFYLLIFVMFNVTHLVRYLTRFTEEIFALLISVFFIYKAFYNVIQITETFPIMTGFQPSLVPMCLCILNLTINETVVNDTVTNETQCQSLNGESLPAGCSYTPPFYVPDIFLMSVILFMGTFVVILILREVKNTSFFASKVRIAIADFSVLGAVVIMTGFDALVGLNTPKLEVPHTFSPSSDRNWFVPFVNSNPGWIPVFAFLPAILLTINVFMDQEITTVIVNRKENKLRKGYGYHLDLLVLAILIAICSIFGLPWFVAATVLSITHVNSLKYASSCSAPGEKSRFIGVREQRMTHFMVYLLVGLSFFFTGVLQYIPMPVLYGVFLFMGVTALKGLQFFERIMILFMPEKYQPDYSYLRRVPINRVRMYTLTQLGLFALLFICKLIKATSVLFPLLLCGVILVRNILSRFFEEKYLKILDDVMPEKTQFKKYKDDNSTTDQNSSMSEVVCEDKENSKSGINNVPRHNSHANINITEVLTQSNIWKSINQQSSKASKKFLVARKKKKRRSKRESAKSEEHRKLSVMEEEDEEENPTSSSLSPTEQHSVLSDSPLSPESKP